MEIPYTELTGLAIIISQQIWHALERRVSHKREDELIKAVIANNLTEYTAATETAKDKIKVMNAEGDLAEKAADFEERILQGANNSDLTGTRYPVS